MKAKAYNLIFQFRMFKSLFIIVFFWLAIASAFAQKIVADTILIDFIPDTIAPSNYYQLHGITDMRHGNHRIVSYGSKNKYLLIPVDQEFSTPKPIAEHFMEGIKKSNSSNKLALEIDYFKISRIPGRIKPYWNLHADLPVYQLNDTGKVFLGTLSYSQEYQAAKKESRSESCEKMLHNWHRDFKLDLLTLNPEGTSKKDNFLLQEINRPYMLNITTASVVSWNFWQLEAEVYFTRPDLNKQRKFNANIIRYQNTADFESFAIGRKAAHVETPLGKNTKIDASVNVLIGFNKWREVAEKEIKLQQILNLSVSGTQCLSYSKPNQAGMIAKVGLFENVYYIIEKNIKFQVGLYVSLGYKF